MVVEVEIQKKKSKKEQLQEEYERQLRLAIQREKRKIVVDNHKIHFLFYMSHLRYQMLCVKEFCSKYKEKLPEFSHDFTLTEDKLLNFRKKFKSSGQKKLPVETSLKSSVDRLLYVIENSVYENDKDLVLVYIMIKAFYLIFRHSRLL